MIAAVLALAVSVAPALPPEIQRASTILQEHMKAGAPETRVGSWVMYRFAGGSERVYFMRLAVTGEEVDPLGRPAWWMELEFGSHAAMKAPMAQMRMLVAKTEGMTAAGVTRVVATWGVARPIELDKDAIALLFKKQEPEKPVADPDEDPKMKVKISTRTGNPTRLVTLAGTVDAVPFEVRLRDTVVKRMWVSRQVPLLQLAKIEMPAIDHTMEVRDFGQDAKPRIMMPAKGSPLVGVTHFADEAEAFKNDDPEDEVPSALQAAPHGP